MTPIKVPMIRLMQYQEERARIDLSKGVAGLNVLAFHEIDRRQLAVNLTAHRDRIPGLYGARSGQIDRHILCPGLPTVTGITGGGLRAEPVSGAARCQIPAAAASARTRIPANQGQCPRDFALMWSMVIIVQCARHRISH